MTTLLERQLPDLSASSHVWLNPLGLVQDHSTEWIGEQSPKNAEFNTNLPIAHPPKSGQSSKLWIPRNSISPGRARHLDRNRVAANRCRLKRKQESETIQNILSKETAKRQMLKAEVNQLKEGLCCLKDRLFAHAGCKDQFIDLELARIAHDVLGGNPDPARCPSPAFSASTWSEGSVDTSVMAGLDHGSSAALGTGTEDLLDGFIDPTKLNDRRASILQSYWK
ncbi:hypothetical protein N7492_010594 [Penicillium capsulatum]|uniref:BZIP domain-containing protein n=1 Tax=Penicillium capsulatum TaxID=69766 RepID=A0A9W9HNY3_9EURO|nr:hypothetical protein N7492_010594 [Penicillium capsulatum]KAJ6113093.1 hypothetical protein N7512_008417 [Penicillium capsulatum]